MTGANGSDTYHCPECRYVWSGYNRPPPYPYCPECGYAMMRRGEPDDGDDDYDHCDECGHVLGTNMGCRTCLFHTEDDDD